MGTGSLREDLSEIELDVEITSWAFQNELIVRTLNAKP